MFREANSYLVVDLEATCDETPMGAIPRGENEIIEIGAVRVDGATLHPVAELDLFVRPIRHPRLTRFCTELTSITQVDVDAAPHFPEVAERLAAFGRGALFCSWGNFDRVLLDKEAQRHRVAPPLGTAHWNLKERFAELHGRRGGVGTMAVLRRLGIVFEGTHHRGIDDARNIARILPYLRDPPRRPQQAGKRGFHDPELESEQDPRDRRHGART